MTDHPSGLSRRGAALADAPPVPEYLMEHFARSSTASDDPPYTPMCVAENRLVWDLLAPKLGPTRTPPHSVVCYDNMRGSYKFRRQLADFMGPAFLGREVDPENLAVLAGAGSVLEIIFHNLADPGEGVLVPTPSYAGFWMDLETRDQLKIIPVHCSADDGFQLRPSLLDQAIEEADRPVRALLFTTPNNPLGRVYSQDEIRRLMEWAESRKIHIVFDEIYALSVFGSTPFTSSASLRSQLGDFFHIVWAFSKDFGASGLRCGVMLSENRDLMAAVDGLAYWAACSGHTQFVLGEMISDERWRLHYIKSMQQRLRDAYHAVSSALDTEGIPYLPAEAGFFILCDFRSFLAQRDWLSEHHLWRRLLEKAGVNLTPGAACHNAEPGFLRLCFAAVPTAEAVAGVQRIGSVLNLS